MPVSRKTSSPHIEIVPASVEQAPILANLLELYAHDFSEFMDLELDEDGRYGYEHLSRYWREPHHYPFLVKVDGKLAGFVFVQRATPEAGDEHVWDVAEFFIVRGYRRLGIGIKAAHEVWRKFPGRWQVRVMDRNQKAKAFWARAVNEFIGSEVNPTTFEKDGHHWHLFSFESVDAA